MNCELKENLMWGGGCEGNVVGREGERLWDNSTISQISDDIRTTVNSCCKEYAEQGL